ncbi:MAG: flagellar export chaperone FliS [Steroidobacteraceae bacterium]|nr:flagellar export chaperone FliS [Steroidobacteraceae bacterium]
MTATSRASMLAAYQMVATHGSVTEADPHRLIVMLMDGALSRIAQARGCMERKATAEKSLHLQRAIAIVDELRCSLDLSQGELAQNLDSLYDFMSRQLLQAHVSDRLELLDRTASLLQEIRGAWIALPPEARALRKVPR